MTDKALIEHLKSQNQLLINIINYPHYSQYLYQQAKKAMDANDIVINEKMLALEAKSLGITVVQLIENKKQQEKGRKRK